MAKRNDPVARARGRKPAPVKKPFPWGFAAGCLALLLFLGGIITYAVVNTGIGDKSSLKHAEHAISGLTSKHGLSRNHKDGVAISYPNQSGTPPIGGDHNPVPQSCQVYTAAIANEHAVHSLEHGAVWITYNPSLSAGDVATLKKLVDGEPARMLSPYPGLKKPISVQAWGEQIFATKASDPRIKQFAELFTKGPQDLEPNNSCVGTTATGPIVPTGATPSGTPTPKATSSAKATASPAATKK